jgi:CHASE2 domain-containing sensor protein/tRNA A-37 threonylcarbamoyl transferase component Bud32
MNNDFWKRDWFSALVITALFGLAAYTHNRVLETLERHAYDLGVRMTNRNSGATDRIAIIAIDDASIEKIGRWPWPRSQIADMLDQLRQAKPKLIALQMMLSENQTDPGLDYIHKVNAVLTGSRLSHLAPNESSQIAQIVSDAEQQLNTDRKLAQAIPATGNVLLPLLFQLGPAGDANAALPDFVRRNALGNVSAVDATTGTLTAQAARAPLPEFGQGTAGIGHLNRPADVDGGVRTEPLVIDYAGAYYPSLALLIAAKSLDLRPEDIKVHLGEAVLLGNRAIKTDRGMRMYTGFYPPRHGASRFRTYSFFDVQTGRAPLSLFRDKIVLIGASASGIDSAQATPVSPHMSSTELTANVVASLLDADFYTRPAWAFKAELAMFVVALLYLMLILPRLSPRSGGVTLLILCAVLVGAGHYLLVTQQAWVKVMTPALLLMTTYMWFTAKHFLVAERAQSRAKSDSAHTNRMLGLAFQGQGQLDMAMDKFRALPIDDSVLDLIYHLALDFERKRQFNKAGAAYEYILKHNSRFKDARERRARAQQADGAVMLGAKIASPGGTLVLDVDHKPTLGRYQVDKEIGKGAMGAVYLGRDPKINRVVAIKTMALSEEFAGHELDEAKARFFREAETAGRLNHPNIVTIYDAGEDQDLAYIAMEYLQGQDLMRYIEPDQLLPPAHVAQIIEHVAEALHYAHEQEVVHRDIKPANIMYDGMNVKVTDFGIARIADASRTKTGLVLGTPSYMSPEQLAAKPLDGRSDLFSLGVTLFELLSGTLPFQGDSMATLMYQIANEKHPDITRLRPNLPSCLRAFMNKALHKDPEQRFQTGEDFAQAMSKCLARAGAA